MPISVSPAKYDRIGNIISIVIGVPEKPSRRIPIKVAINVDCRFGIIMGVVDVV
jgi:hypothetical protein